MSVGPLAPPPHAPGGPPPPHGMFPDQKVCIVLTVSLSFRMFGFKKLDLYS